MMAEEVESIPAPTNGVCLKETGTTNGGSNGSVNNGGAADDPGVEQEDDKGEGGTVSYEMYKTVLEERDQLSLTLKDIKQQVNY